VELNGNEPSQQIGEPMPDELQPIAARFGIETGDGWEIVCLKMMARMEELERSIIRLNAITMNLAHETANLEALQRVHSVVLGGGA